MVINYLEGIYDYLDLNITLPNSLSFYLVAGPAEGPKICELRQEISLRRKVLFYHDQKLHKLNGPLASLVP